MRRPERRRSVWRALSGPRRLKGAAGELTSLPVWCLISTSCRTTVGFGERSRSLQQPYGGVGASGIGNYYGKYGFDALTHAKSILVSPADVAIDHLFPPYTGEKVKALAQWFDY